VDLTGKVKANFFIGRGRTGKTTLARWAYEGLAERGGTTIIAAADPVNRTLVNYLDGVAQPLSTDPLEVRDWLIVLLQHAMSEKLSVMVDLGGGDTSLIELLKVLPNLVTLMAEGGMEAVAIHVMGVAFLEAVEHATQKIGQPLSREQIEQVAHDLVREAKWAAAQSLSQENRRYLLNIALGAMAGVALCVALTIGASFYGRSETQGAIADMPSLLLNAHAVETWAKIIRNNNIQAVMDECKPQLDSSGRYACWIGLWTDAPNQPQAKW
jgi:hypothetical protein